MFLLLEATGLPKAVTSKANKLLAISKMVFPHKLLD